METGYDGGNFLVLSRTEWREMGVAASLVESEVLGKTLNVLTLTPFYPTRQDPAAGCFVAEALAATARLGIRNSVIAVQPLYRRTVSGAGAPHGARWVRYLSVPGRWGLASAGAFLCAKIINFVRARHATRPIQLIHAHAPLPSGHAALLISRELGIPYVVSVHGLDAYSTEQKTGFGSEWRARVCSKVYAGASRIICISEQVRRRVLLEGSRNYRTSLVYNGVDPDLFSPHGLVAEPTMSIASVGNLIPIKGHELLLRAMARVRERFPAVRCEIVGRGPELHRLQRLAVELKVTGRVAFLGKQSREDVARLLQRSALFVLPSRFEGLGCVYLEAMSTGLAVIGCREQGIEELIRHGNNGWLVGPGNLDELTDGLGTLLENGRLREQIGQHARTTILQGLTLDHQARRLQQIYQECAA